MRPLKPYVLALGGLIAAVFGAVFLGAPSATLAAPISGHKPDLQSKRIAPAGGVVANRDAKPAGKVPAPQPQLPILDFLRSETLRVIRKFASRPLLGAPGRIIDRRQLMLVGVVELRI